MRRPHRRRRNDYRKRRLLAEQLEVRVAPGSVLLASLPQVASRPLSPKLGPTSNALSNLGRHISHGIQQESLAAFAPVETIPEKFSPDVFHDRQRPAAVEQELSDQTQFSLDVANFADIDHSWLPEGNTLSIEKNATEQPSQSEFSSLSGGASQQTSPITPMAPMGPELDSPTNFDAAPAPERQPVIVPPVPNSQADVSWSDSSPHDALPEGESVGAPAVTSDNVSSDPSPAQMIPLGFDDALVHWRTEQTGSTDFEGGAREAALPGTVELFEGDSFLTTLQRDVFIPDDALTLRFSYQANFDSTSGGDIQDAFEVVLEEQNNTSLVHTFAEQRDAFFNLTEGLPPAVGNGVTVTHADNTTHVELDISGIEAGTDARVRFRLVNNDGDSEGLVALSNVILEAGVADQPPTVSARLANDTFPDSPDNSEWNRDGLTNDPTISGNVSDDVGLERLEVRIDDGDAIDISSNVVDGVFTYLPSELAAGPHRITVLAVDTSGQTSTASVELIVNSAPNLDAVVPLEINEGDLVTLDASSSTDLEGELTFLWTLPDGTTRDNSIASWPAVQDGKYQLALAITDSAGTVTGENFEITVNNVVPMFDPIEDMRVERFDPLLVVHEWTDPGLQDSHSAEVDWGDGTITPATIWSNAGRNFVVGSHAYQAAGTFSWKLTVGDELETRSAAAEVLVNGPFGDRNPRIALDADDDGNVSPVDALLVINELNAKSTRPVTTNDLGVPFLDIDNDLIYAPVDVLLIVNYLNSSAKSIPYTPTPPKLSTQLIFDTAADGNLNVDKITQVPELLIVAGGPHEVDRIEVELDGNSVSLTTPHADGTYHFAAADYAQLLSSPLVDRKLDLTIRAIDQAGNLSNEIAFMMELDRKSPDVTEIEVVDEDPGAEGELQATSEIIQLQGLTEPFASIHLDAQNLSTIADEHGQFLLGNISVPFGQSLLELRIADLAGNESTVSQAVTRWDTTAPHIDIHLANDTGVSNTDRITRDPSLAGKLADESQITRLKVGLDSMAETEFLPLAFDVATGEFTVNESQLRRLSPGAWTDGLRSVHFVAEDDAGNQSPTASFTFQLDQTPPDFAPSTTAFVADEVNSLEIEFSEVVSSAAFEDGSYQLRRAAGFNEGELISLSSVQLDAQTVRLDLAETLTALDYTLAVSTLVSDVAGNPLSIPNQLDFKVVVPVEIESFSPYHGEEMVNGRREVTIRFANEIDPNSVTPESFYVVANGARIAGTTRVSTTNRFLTFFPNEPLPASTRIRVVVDGALLTAANGVGIDANSDGHAGGIGVAEFHTSPLTSIEGTSISGYVLDAHRTVEPESLPIPVPSGDPHFDPMSSGTATIRFSRATYVGSTGSSESNPRQHVTLITSFLDGSLVYGSDEGRTEQLRESDGSGRLKVSAGNLLPLNNDTFFPDGSMQVENQGPFADTAMFVAGDIRAAENPGLTALHTLLVREHNRYATAAKSNDPALTEEQLFQAARRWVGAILQQITYQEFLPALLGASPLPTYTGYDSSVDPSISAAFSGAAFRFGHSMQVDTILRLNDEGESLDGGPLALQQSFFNPQPLSNDGIEPYLRGLIQQQANEVDVEEIDALRNFLFGPPGAGGMDLAAINVQRGRDLGLPGYNQARKDFGLAAVTEFSEITSNSELAEALQATYGDIESVDLWVGGLAEDHVTGGTVGELFAAIIADQFQRSRDGDRFWFENSQFTDEELAAIRQTTLAKLITQNSNIDSLPANVFSSVDLPAGHAAAGTAAAEPSSEYRRIDGVGNHPNHLGRAGAALLQNFSLNYDDNIAQPASSGRPGPREISNQLFAQKTQSTNKASLTSMFVAWGQFIDHDLSKTPSQSSSPTIIPVAGATLTVEGADHLSTTTDATGFFILEDLPAPEVFVRIDGANATNAPDGGRYTYVAKPFETIPGQAVPLSKNGEGFDIYLPVVPADAAQELSTTEMTSLTFQPQTLAMAAEVFPDLTPEMLELFSLDLEPGTALDRQGNPVAEGFVVPVPSDRLPAPLPPGFDTSLVVSIQAPGAENFDTPAAVTFPNTDGLAPGEKTLLFSYDHDAGEWVPVGSGTVREDGKAVVSDPGVGIQAPGWHIIQVGVIVRGNLVVGQRGSLFGRNATDELSPQTGRHFYALENLDNGFTIRGKTDVVDRIFDRQILAANTQYRLSVYGLASGQFGSVEFETPDNGTQITAPIAVIKQQDLADTDGDGLQDVAERIVGTSIESADTDHDGIRDLAELRQGLSPFDDRPFPTGIVSQLPLNGSAMELVVAGSSEAPEKQTAYVATDAGLAIVDVSEFNNPIVLGTMDLGVATDVAVDSNLNIAAVATGSDGLHLIDVSDPMMPKIRETITLTTNQVEVVEGVAYFESERRIRAFDLLSGDALGFLRKVTSGRIISMAVEGSLLYSLDDTAKVQIVDLGNFDMALRGSLTLPKTASNVFVGDGVLYAPTRARAGSSRGGYMTVDVSDPDNLRLLADALPTNTAVTGPGMDAASNGSGIVLIIGGFGPVPDVLDVHDAADPETTDAVLTRIFLSGQPQDVQIASGMAYVAASDAGLIVANFKSFDSGGVAPTLEISTSLDIDPGTEGQQVETGDTVPILVKVSDVDDGTIADDDDARRLARLGQVRNVELIVDGIVVQNDVSFPFDSFSVIAPQLDEAAVVVQVRATDTGGNTTISEPLTLAPLGSAPSNSEIVDVLPDTTAPAVTNTNPPDGGLRGSNFRTLRIGFSESMDEATLIADNFRLLGPKPPQLDIVEAAGQDQFNPIDIQIRKKAREVQLTYAQLIPGDYELQLVSNALTDRAGNAISDQSTLVVSRFEILDASIVWVNDVGGAWTDPDNWDTAQIPGPEDDVFIGMPEDIQVTLADGDVELRSLTTENRLLFKNTTLETPELHTGALVELDGSTLRGVHVQALKESDAARVSTASRLYTSGVLDDVVLDVPLSVLASDSLTARNGLRLNSTATLENFGCCGARITFDGDQILDGNGEVILGQQKELSKYIGPTASSTLTIGRDITIRGMGADIGSSTGNIVNYGTIIAEQGRIRLRGKEVTNHGILAAAGGTLSAPNVRNLGTMSVTSGILDLSGDWQNSGVVSATGGTLLFSSTPELIGNVTVADATLELRDRLTTTRLEQISHANSKVALGAGGVLDNQDHTLTLAADSIAQVVMMAGTLKGGRVSGTGQILASGGRLHSAVIDVNLRVPGGATVTVVNGLTLNGTATLGATGYVGTSTLRFDGDQLLDGTGEVVLVHNWAYPPRIEAAVGNTLTIGHDVTVRVASGSRGSLGTANSTVVNYGAIQGSGLTLTNIDNRGRVTANNGTMTLVGEWSTTTTPVLTNATLELRIPLTNAEVKQFTFDQSRLLLSPGSALDNAGEVVSLGSSAMKELAISGGRINGGTIFSSDTSGLTVTSGGGTLDGVTLDSDAILIAGAQVTVFNSLIVNKTLRLQRTLNGDWFPLRDGRSRYNVGLNFSGGQQTLDGEGSVVLVNYVDWVKSPGAYVRVRPVNGAELTIGSGITMNNVISHAAIGDASLPLIVEGIILSRVAGKTVAVRGSSVTNNGTFQVSAGTLEVSGKFTNSGQLDVAAGHTLSIPSSDFVQTATGTLAIDAGSTSSFGKLTVGGDATLAGEIELNLLNDFQPAVGNSFQVATFASSTGEFTLANPELPNDLALGQVYDETSLTLVVGQPLRAAVSDRPVLSVAKDERLALDSIRLLADQALDLWVSMDVGIEQIEQLRDVEFRIADLTDGRLGFATHDAIWIDDDGAGYGWSLDATMADAMSDNRMDLLRVIMHEQGHLLGLKHSDVHDDLMSSTLLPGRRGPIKVADIASVQSLELPPAFGPLETGGDFSDSRGTEFYLTFPSSIGLTGAEAELSLQISSKIPTSGKVEIPGLGFSRTFSTLPGEITHVDLPLEADLSFTSDQITDRGIHVVSDDEISVHGVSRAPETADTFLALPTDVLGQDYLVLAYKNLDKNPNVFETFPGSQFAIVATQDATNITITPSVDTGLHSAGTSYVVSLNAGQTYFLQNTSGAAADLSGTAISSDRPIAVFGGHAAANVPAPAVAFADYLVEQLPSTDTWGNEFITVPLVNRPGGDTYRVLAAVDGTALTVNGDVVATLNRGELHEMLLTEASHISANHAVLVSQFANSASFDDANSDPFMTLVPAVDQWLGSYTFTTAIPGSDEHFVNISIPTDATGSVLLNGASLAAERFTALDGTGYSFAQLTLDPGTHTLSSPIAFSAMTYGFGADESYGAPAGIAIELQQSLLVSSVELVPESAELQAGSEHTVTATVRDQNDDPLEGIAVQFQVSGVHTDSGFVLTDAAGNAEFVYQGIHIGSDTVTATAEFNADTAQMQWIAQPIQLVINDPASGSDRPAGETLLISGTVEVDPAASVAAVLVNGNPVNTIDAAGNFFADVTITPGENVLRVTAVDSLNQSTSSTTTLFGTQPDEGPDAPELFANILSASFAGIFGRTSFNERTKVLYTDIAAHNAGSFSVDTPLLLSLDQLSNPSLRPRDIDGTNRDLQPYYDFSEAVGTRSLDPDATTAERTIAIYNPLQSPFEYELMFYGQLNEAPQITSVPNQDTPVDRPYTYQAIASDPEEDSTHWTLLSGPSSMSLDANTGALSWTPAAADIGSHTILLEVADDRGGSSQQRFDLQVHSALPNRPPILSSVPEVSAFVGSSYEYQIVAHDADADSLQYSLVTAPLNMQISAAGLIEWTPVAEQAGVQPITIRIDDGEANVEQTYNVLVEAEPGTHAPIITSQPPTNALAGGTYSYDLDAYDADGDSLTYRLTDAPHGMIIDEVTGQIEWQVAKTFVLDFNDLSHNDDQFTGIDELGRASVQEYEQHGFKVEALSPNLLGLGSYGTETPEYSGSPALANRTVSGITRITGQDNEPFDLVSIDLAEAGFSGPQPITVTFTGELQFGGTVTQTFTTDGGNFESQTFHFDGFDDLLAVSWEQQSPFHQFDNVTISSHVRIDNALSPVTAEVRDGRGGVATQQFVIRSAPELPNSAPEIVSTAPTKATIGQRYGYFVNATDADGDSLQYSLDVGPDGMTIDIQTGFLQWTPTDSPEDQEGDHPVTIRVSDSRGASTKQSFTVAAQPPAANEQPNIESTPVTDAVADVVYTYQVIASDPNGDFLTYELTTAPEGMTIDPLRGLIQWSPTREQADLEPVEDTNIEILGLASVEVLVEDGRGGSDPQSFTILVRAVDNLPPRIDSLPPSTATFGVPYVYQVVGSDLDGDSLSFELLAVNNQGTADDPLTQDSFSLPQGKTLDELLAVRGSLNIGSFTVPTGMTLDPVTGLLAWTPELNDFVDVVDAGNGPMPTPNLDASGKFGVKEVLLHVSDGRGGFDVQQFPITVYFPNQPPVILSSPPTRAAASLPYQYRVHAQDAEGSEILFSLDARPAGMSIDEASGVISWTPGLADVGEHDVTLVVRDEDGGESTQSFVLRVAEQDANVNPIVFSHPPQRVRLGGQYLYVIDAFDPNGNPLQYSLNDEPLGMTIGGVDPDTGLTDPQNQIRWIPSADQVASHSFSILIDDGQGGVVTQQATVAVVTDTENEPPRVVSQPTQYAVVGESYAYDVQARDPEGDQLVYELAEHPIGMAIDPLSGTVRWLPSVDQLGHYQVIVSVTDSQGGIARQSYQLSVRPINLPPHFETTPTTIAVVDKVYAYAAGAIDPDGDPLNIQLAAAPAGMSLDPSTGIVLWRPAADQIGEHDVSIRVQDTQAVVATQDFRIQVLSQSQNLPPQITSSPVLQARIGVSYVYQASALDPEGTVTTFDLVTPIDGMTINTDSGILSWTPTEAGEVAVTIAAEDEFGAKAFQSFTIDVRAANQLPKLTGPPLAGAIPGRQYLMNFPAEDPDGDRLTYLVETGPDGMTIDEHGRVTWLPTLADVGTHAVSLTAGDDFGLVRLGFDLLVLEDQQAPQVQVTASANPVLLGDSLTLVVAAVDDVGIEQIELTVNGQAVALDAAGRGSFTPQQAGAITVISKATDLAGNTAEDTLSVDVVDPSVVGAPVVAITSPLQTADIATSRVTGPMDIVGTVDDPDLARYTLEYTPLEGGPFVEFARGTESITDGVLGRLDPTNLANGDYILRLHAVDTGGNEDEFQTLISVSGDAKVGNFTLSFTDLTVLVAGFPLTVSRTYDSLNASEQDDFGFGWRMELSDTNLRTSVPDSGLQDLGVYEPFYYNARVYVSLPGEGRQSFTFQPQPKPGRVGAFLKLWEPRFEPDPGVTSTLSVAHTNLTAFDDGTFNAFGNGIAYNPTNPLFGGSYTLTTKEGIVYQIDAASGDTKQLADRNGNTLTFEDNTIASSSGSALTFERDPQGRIVAVVDPMGKRIRYDYDKQGNLVAVTDREENTTKFIYGEPSRPHFLTEILDPLERTGIRGEYDEHGRLKKMIDADGKEIVITHDPDNLIETVTNQLGYDTSFEYDSLGNVVTEVDAEGGITKYGYDDPKNPTLETSVTQVLEDGTELTTTFVYDTRGNILEETDPAGNSTKSTYDNYGNVLTTTDALGQTTVNRYDSSGNLLSISSPGTAETSFTYDAEGNPLALEIGTNKTEFTYDSAGRVKQQKDAAGATRTFTYDDNGNQLTETVTYTTPNGPSTVVTKQAYDDEGRVTYSEVRQDGVLLSMNTTVYDAVGNSKEQTDGLGRTTRFEYDSRGLLIETIYPDSTPETDEDNPRTRTDYDAAGNVIAEYDELDQVTRYEYDRDGRRTAIIFFDDTPEDPDDNPRITTEYDAVGRVTAQVDQRQHRTAYRYDEAGNQIEVILPDDSPDDLSDNPRVRNGFDELGRTIYTTDPLGLTTAYVFSERGLPEATILPDATPGDPSDNPRLSSKFNDDSRLIGRTDQAGIETGYEYDALGRLSAVIQTVADKTLRTEYEYDELGNLIVQRDANGHETKFEFDGLQRRTATILPMGQRNQVEYDLAGRVQYVTDFNGDKVEYQYDERDRLTARLYPDESSVNFTYRATGERETIVDARGTTSYEYDLLGRLTLRTDPDGRTIAYEYDVAGNRTSVTTLSGTTRYTFDEQNRLATVTDPEDGTTTYGYDAAGRPISTTFPNGTSELREYDEQYRLRFLENKSGDEVISSYRYTLDPAGNRTAIEEHDGRLVEYAYDELYRLVEEKIFDPGDDVVDRLIKYTYDDVGNRLTRDDTADGLTTYDYDDNDLLLEELIDGVATKYTYDENGNTLSKQTGDDKVGYEWDFENRLIGVDNDGDGINDVTNAYDADGVRVAQTVDGDETRFLIDTNRPYAQVLEEYTPGGVLKVSYVHGLDLISQNRHGDTAKSFYHVDGLGSTRALSDALGIVTDRYIYDAFGNTIGQLGSTGNVYLFAGEQRDLATGLDYLRARWMSPSVGRFVSRDSFDGFRDNPITLNKHLYADANPINKLDPSGLYSLLSAGKAFAIQSALNARAGAVRAVAGAAVGTTLALIGRNTGKNVLAQAQQEAVWDIDVAFFNVATALLRGKIRTLGGLVGAGGQISVGTFSGRLREIRDKTSKKTVFDFDAKENRDVQVSVTDGVFGLIGGGVGVGFSFGLGLGGEFVSPLVSPTEDTFDGVASLVNAAASAVVIGPGYLQLRFGLAASGNLKTASVSPLLFDFSVSILGGLSTANVEIPKGLRDNL